MRRFSVAAVAALCVLAMCASGYGLDDPAAARDETRVGWDVPCPQGWDTMDPKKNPTKEQFDRLTEEEQMRYNSARVSYWCAMTYFLPRLAGTRLSYLAALADKSFVFSAEMKKELDEAGMAYLRSGYYYDEIDRLANKAMVQSNTAECIVQLCDAADKFYHEIQVLNLRLNTLEHQISKPRWEKWQKQFADERAELEKNKKK